VPREGGVHVIVVDNSCLCTEPARNVCLCIFEGGGGELMYYAIRGRG
jgi:hypothetical protein